MTHVTAALLFLVVSAADAGESDAGVAPEPRGLEQVRVQPGTAKPGDAVLITVHGSREVPVGTLGSWNLNFLPFRGGYQALIGLPADLKLVPLKLSLQFRTDEREERYAVSLDVVDPSFRKDELKVAKKFTSPAKAEKKWMREDQVAFNAAWGTDLSPRLFQEPFIWPRVARLSAPFGDRRLFNGKQQSQHQGIDIDGEIGEPAWASNDGVVVMVRECFGSGNTVIVHHGAGLFTAYFHLSRFDVKRGEQVTQGQQLGLVGKTGRVTGPHLHFGTKIDGRWVDPQSVLKLDFE